MKPLAASNRYLQSARIRNIAVERNVRSSSAIEGVSASVFRSAVDGRLLTRADDASHAKAVSGPRPKKRK